MEIKAIKKKLNVKVIRKKKTNLQSFSGESILMLHKQISGFLEENPRIRVTAMAMTYDTHYQWYHTFITYEEGE